MSYGTLFFDEHSADIVEVWLAKGLVYFAATTHLDRFDGGICDVRIHDPQGNVVSVSRVPVGRWRHGAETGVRLEFPLAMRSAFEGGEHSTEPTETEKAEIERRR